MATKHYLSYLQDTMKTNWNGLAMTDLDGEHRYTYADLAREIVKLHVTWREMGIKEGDKIALCGRNCANWGLLFLAIESYKAVTVSILPDFTTEGIYSLGGRAAVCGTEREEAYRRHADEGVESDHLHG